MSLQSCLRLAYALLTVTLVAVAAWTLEPRAHAYVDPGSGLFVLQAAGTVLTGVLYALRRRVARLFRRSRSVASDAGTGSSPSTSA